MYADWEEGSPPPNICFRFLSARIQSSEDFRFLTPFFTSSAKFCHTGSHDGAHETRREFKLQSQTIGGRASFAEKEIEFCHRWLQAWQSLSSRNQIIHSTASSSVYFMLILGGGAVHILTINCQALLRQLISRISRIWGPYDQCRSTSCNHLLDYGRTSNVIPPKFLSLLRVLRQPPRIIFSGW